MGLPNGQDFSYVAVEFDTMLDPNFGDVNDNHIGIDVDSVVSVASVDGFSKGIDLKSEREMTAWIEYRDKEETIEVKKKIDNLFHSFLVMILTFIINFAICKPMRIRLEKSKKLYKICRIMVFDK